MRKLVVMAAVAAAAVAAGCGGGSGDGDTSPGSADPVKTTETVAQTTTVAKGSAARPGRTIKIVDSQFGAVVADAKGEAFYFFGKERSRAPRCFGPCAQAWPPVITKGKPRAGSGADAALLGTVKRPDGRLQVTYNNRPLYYYVSDSPGSILCQDVYEFGGLWQVVDPSGEPVA